MNSILDFETALSDGLVGFIPEPGTDRADWFADYIFWIAGLLTDADLIEKYGRDARLIAADIEYSLELRAVCEKLRKARLVRKIPTSEVAMCKLLDKHSDALRMLEVA